MRSLWKDLVYVNRYLTGREDRLWREQTEGDTSPTVSLADAPSRGAGKAKSPKKCAPTWPRLAAPR